MYFLCFGESMILEYYVRVQYVRIRTYSSISFQLSGIDQIPIPNIHMVYK